MIKYFLKLALHFCLGYSRVLVSDIFMNGRQHFEVDLYGLNDKHVHTCTATGVVWECDHSGSLCASKAIIGQNSLYIHCMCMYLQFLACGFLIPIVNANL